MQSSTLKSSKVWIDLENLRSIDPQVISVAVKNLLQSVQEPGNSVSVVAVAKASQSPNLISPFDAYPFEFINLDLHGSKSSVSVISEEILFFHVESHVRQIVPNTYLVTNSPDYLDLVSRLVKNQQRVVIISSNESKASGYLNITKCLNLALLINWNKPTSTINNTSTSPTYLDASTLNSNLYNNDATLRTISRPPSVNITKSTPTESSTATTTTDISNAGSLSFFTQDSNTWSPLLPTTHTTWWSVSHQRQPTSSSSDSSQDESKNNASTGATTTQASDSSEEDDDDHITKNNTFKYNVTADPIKNLLGPQSISSNTLSQTSPINSVNKTQLIVSHPPGLQNTSTVMNLASTQNSNNNFSIKNNNNLSEMNMMNNVLFNTIPNTQTTSLKMSPIMMSQSPPPPISQIKNNTIIIPANLMSSVHINNVSSSPVSLHSNVDPDEKPIVLSETDRLLDKLNAEEKTNWLLADILLTYIRNHSTRNHLATSTSTSTSANGINNKNTRTNLIPSNTNDSLLPDMSNGFGLTNSTSFNSLHSQEYMGRPHHSSTTSSMTSSSHISPSHHMTGNATTHLYPSNKLSSTNTNNNAHISNDPNIEYRIYPDTDLTEFYNLCPDAKTIIFNAGGIRMYCGKFPKLFIYFTEYETGRHCIKLFHYNTTLEKGLHDYFYRLDKLSDLTTKQKYEKVVHLFYHCVESVNVDENSRFFPLSALMQEFHIRHPWAKDMMNMLGGAKQLCIQNCHMFRLAISTYDSSVYVKCELCKSENMVTLPSNLSSSTSISNINQYGIPTSTTTNLLLPELSISADSGLGGNNANMFSPNFNSSSSSSLLVANSLASLHPTSPSPSLPQTNSFLFNMQNNSSTSLNGNMNTMNTNLNMSMMNALSGMNSTTTTNVVAPSRMVNTVSMNNIQELHVASLHATATSMNTNTFNSNSNNTTNGMRHIHSFHDLSSYLDPLLTASFASPNIIPPLSRHASSSSLHSLTSPTTMSTLTHSNATTTTTGSSSVSSSFMDNYELRVKLAQEIYTFIIQNSKSQGKKIWDAELGYFFRKHPNAKAFLKSCGGIKAFCSQHGDLLRVVEIAGKEAFLIRAVNVLHNSAKLGLI